MTAFLVSLPLYPPNLKAMAVVVPPASAQAFYATLLATCVVVAALCLVACRLNKAPRKNVEASAAFWACAVVYTSCAAAGWALALIGAYDQVSAVALGVLTGLSAGPLVVLWARAFDVGFASTMLHGGVVCAFTSTVPWFVSNLSPVAAAAFSVACAVVGSVAPVVMRECQTESSREDSHGKAQPSTGLKNVFSAIWLPFLGLLVSALILNMGSLDVGFGVGTELVGGVVASALVVVICLVPKKTSFVVLIDRVVLPVALAFCLFAQSFGPGNVLFSIGRASIFAPLSLVSVYAIATLVTVMHDEEVDAVEVFAAAMLAASTASAVGFACGHVVDVTAPAGGQALWVMVSGYICVVIVNLAYTAWKQALPADEEVPASGADQTGAPPSAPRTLEEMRHERLAAIAAAHGLSKREAEVFDLLAQGYGSSYIATALFISNNTARTHVRNIYRKLKVSSRDEMLTLVRKESVVRGSAVS